MPLIDPKDRKWLVMGLQIAGDFGASIAFPVVILVYIGQKIDKTYNTGIVITILAFVLSAVLSGWLVYRKAKVYAKEYQNFINKDENNNHSEKK